MSTRIGPGLLAALAMVAASAAAATLAAESPPDADAIVIEDEAASSSDTIVSGEDAEESDSIELEDDAESGSADAIRPESNTAVGAEPKEDGTIDLEEGGAEQERTATSPESGGRSAAPAAPAAPAASTNTGFALRADKLRLEYAPLVGSDESVDALGYGGAEVSLSWAGGGRWEARLAGRADAFLQDGDPQFDDVEADYGESYVRYRGDKLRVTLGTQTVVWGRIDEIPPNDRLSVHDYTRFILDDLQDRRRARPMLRIEGFADENKLEILWLPTFREAELPDRDSIWYPIDRRRGEILGFEGNPLLREVVKGALIDDDAPDSDNAVGLRFSRSEGALDFALTAQNGRQSAPYFEYDQPGNTFEARYPSARSLGADLGIETGGMLWRFEAAWISDMPVTRENFRYDTVEGVNWAAGIEFYPGDGDARVNLQFAATNLDASDVLDRADVYNVNGSMEFPFAQDRWRAKMRFFAGLDERDVYVNPELVFMGWQPHSFYVEAHVFDGDAGTLGGFHDEHSLVAVGWRAEF